MSDLPPPITAEEMRQIKRAQKKARRLALKAAKAERKRLAQLQLRRDMLKREEHFRVVTYERCQSEWLEMMTKIRQVELKDELQTFWDSVQPMIDAKDNHIDRLLEDNRHAEEQFHRCSEEHLKFMDMAQKYFELFIKTLRDSYDAQAFAILTEFHKECMFNDYIGKRHRTFFENTLIGRNAIHNTNLDQQLAENYLEARDTFIINSEMIREAVVGHMSRMHELMLNAVHIWRHDKSAKIKLDLVLTVVQRDDLFIKQTQKQIDSLNAERDALTKQLHAQLLANTRELQLSTLEKTFFVECLQQIQRQYTFEVQLDERNLRRVMGAFNKSVNDLTALERKGGLLLALSAACNKLLTEQEKMPVYFEKLSAEEVDVDAMRPFIRRMALARSDNVALAEEKQFLTNDNAKLLDQIRRYCTQFEYEKCIATLKIPATQVAGPTAQEANHLVWNRQVQKNYAKK